MHGLELFAIVAALLCQSAHAQCSWACPSGYTLSNSATGSCTKTYAATATYSCASGYALSGTSCSRDLCGGTMCYSLSNVKCCGTGYVGAAAPFNGGYSCYTYEGGPGGYWCKRVSDGLRACWSSYSCPSCPNTTSDAGVCTVSASVSYSCPSGGSLSGTTCTLTAQGMGITCSQTPSKTPTPSETPSQTRELAESCSMLAVPHLFLRCLLRTLSHRVY